MWIRIRGSICLVFGFEIHINLSKSLIDYTNICTKLKDLVAKQNVFEHGGCSNNENDL